MSPSYPCPLADGICSQHGRRTPVPPRKPTGALTLTIREVDDVGRKSWTDGKPKHLEDCLNMFVRALVRASQVLEQRRIKREEQERRWKAEREESRRQEKARQKEAQLIERLARVPRPLHRARHDNRGGRRPRPHLPGGRGRRYADHR